MHLFRKYVDDRDKEPLKYRYTRSKDKQKG